MLRLESVNTASDTTTDITPVEYVHVIFFVSDPVGGSINPEPSPISGGWYAKNVWYSISATPNNGFRFLSYTCGMNATVTDKLSNPTQFKVNDTTVVAANFIIGNVVPEVPLGTSIASATMIAALLLYFIWPRKGKTTLP